MRMILSAIIGGCVLGAMASAQEELRPLPRPSDETVEDAVTELVVETAEDEQAAEAEFEDVAALAVLPLDTLPVARPGDLLVGYEYRLALTAAFSDEWEKAAAYAAVGDPVGADLIEWRRLRAGVGTFAEYQAFLAKNDDWPGLDRIQERGERTIPDDAGAAEVIAYFDGRAPETGQGALRLASALETQGNGDTAEAVIVTAWTTLPMRAVEEANFFARYADVLKPHHEARLDMLLWAKDRDGVDRMKAHVSDGWKALADARIALQREAKGVDALIGKVPAELSGNGGLAYDRMIWRIENRQRGGAVDLIIETSTSAEALGRPEAWAEWRRVLARQAMRAGEGERAYTLAAKHFIDHSTEFYPYADLEWLAGYLALQYRDDPEQALIHFQRFTAAVYTPISASRGHYWQGRAREAMGDTEAAMAAYREGGKHQSTYYGQLAAEKAGLETDATLAGYDAPVDWTQASFADGSVLRAAVLNFNAGQTWETIRFLSHLADTMPKDELRALSAFTQTLGDPFVSVRVAKQIVRRGVVPMDTYFPMVNLGIELPVEEALALSIARRESEFNIAATSPVGARGLMQLMPGTAQNMARKVGLPYAASKLTTDAVFNATLGSAYLAELIDEFGPNYALVAAGYNAGPGRPRRWIELYGDPRNPDVDPVDWVEHIPFRETRDYVMRVTESLAIYRARLAKEVAPLKLSEELKAAGG